MSPERLLKIEELFLAAIEIEDRAARAHFLEEACAGDVELKKQVEHLVRQDAEAGTFLRRPIAEESAIHVFAELIDDDPFVGQKIGKYLIEREIGAGGMGAVYLARRADGSFEKRVAIKIVKRGMDTKFILRRFRQERQVLALLDHPFIAPLLDGGTTADGLPYFVMEHVEGEPLYRYADQNKLSVGARLELFVKICAAVAYAHENKVVHRDLKPSNILIKRDGSPRLLDFGIAKVFNPDFHGDVTVEPTQTAMRLMTPEYASPEQVRGDTVSAASDIYSLGVVLYELLTGHRPYRFKNRAPHEIARVICEEEPDRPATSVTREDNLLPKTASEATTLADVLRVRGAADLESLQKELSGEIERVILKCLRKKPNERYQTAAALIEDIARFLNGERVQAEAFHPAAGPVQAAADGEKSIAVLPLKMIGAAHGDDEYLSIGLADALISRLAKVPRFIVRPTSSVLKFQGETVDSLAAGRALDVGFIVEGTIRRAGGRVRVGAQLLDVNSGSTVWAENFDENQTDIFALEDAVAARVFDVLLPKLTGEERRRFAKRPTDSPAAYEAYLRGRYHLYQVAPAEFAKAKMYFEEALRHDADFALAYVGLAEYFFIVTAFAPVPSAENLNFGYEMAKRALEIDDSLGEVWAVYAFFSRAGLEEVEQILDRSVALNAHHSLARVYRSGLYIVQRRFDEAVAEARLAVRLNPLSAFEQAHLTWILYQARRFAESIAAGEQLIAANPHFSLGYGILSQILAHVGETKKAIETAEEGLKLNPESPTILCGSATAHAKAGETGKARRILDELLETRKSKPFSPFDLAILHLNLGDRDGAFAELQNALLARVPQLLWIGTEPELDPIRDDERFLKLVQMMQSQRGKT